MNFGFLPNYMPECMFDFQRAIVDWACRKGRAAIFADCGLGKTLMQLVWAENVVQHTGGNVLILTPLAVSHQTVLESSKFGIKTARSNYGEITEKIMVTNYERLEHFKPSDFAGIVCDESSILKNYSGKTRDAITEFMAQIEFRLLCTATAAPNDFMELGTSSEALGYLKYKEMLSMFFSHDGGETSKWALKGHAQKGPFWRWMCTWAMAIRHPSDLGFSAKGYDLPELKIRRHIVASNKPQDGHLFVMPAVGLDEQREERRRTLKERCEMAAQLICSHDKPAIAWCHLNVEGDMLENLIPGAVQVSGSDTDEKKESAFRKFENGEIRVIITKPSLAGHGLNWQHCNHQTFFPSHSFEQWYQAIRRCWRYGQKNPVTVDVISSEGESDVVANLERKAKAAEMLFGQIVNHMSDQIKEETKKTNQTQEIELPSWL